jgi:hypothetical protein
LSFIEFSFLEEMLYRETVRIAGAPLMHCGQGDYYFMHTIPSQIARIIKSSKVNFSRNSSHETGMNLHSRWDLSWK